MRSMTEEPDDLAEGIRHISAACSILRSTSLLSHRVQAVAEGVVAGLLREMLDVAHVMGKAAHVGIA